MGRGSGGGDRKRYWLVNRARYICVEKNIIMKPVLVRVSIAAAKYHGQASWVGKGLFGLHFSITVHH